MYKHNDYTGVDTLTKKPFTVYIKPTFKIQMESLLKFASWIGYEMCPKTCQFEYIFKYDSTDKPVIAFNTMVRSRALNSNICAKARIDTALVKSR